MLAGLISKILVPEYRKYFLFSDSFIILLLLLYCVIGCFCFGTVSPFNNDSFITQFPDNIIESHIIVLLLSLEDINIISPITK